MKNTLLHAAFAAAITLALPLFAAAQAAPQPGGRITMNFEDVELPVFVKFISEVTGRNFVFTDRVSGTISVVSPTPVTPEEAYAVFQSVMAARGLTTIDDGLTTRIVLLKDARGQTSGHLEGDASGFTTRLIPLRHVEAEDMAAVLSPLVGKEGSITPYRATNTIIVSDTAQSIERVGALISSLDLPRHEETLEVIRLENADATALSEQITETLLGARDNKRGNEKGSAALARHGFKIVADDRTNSLIVVASEVDLRRIRSLTRSLDTPLRPGDSRIHVYYARHANAEDLVDVISGMLSGRRSRRGSTDASSTGGGTAGVRAAGAPSDLGEEVSITSDPATNAVIVNASGQDYRTILSLLESLDIPRPQVFIEAIIVEATLDDTRALGFDFQAGGGVGDGAGLVRANLSNLNAAFLNPASLAGLILAATSDKTIELPDGTEVPANVLLFQALDRNTDINVLSAPTLLTLDNQEAEILVGENIPFVTGRASDITELSNVFTQVERRDVGIKLKVRPQVSEGNLVVLDVEEEVSSVVDTGISEQIIVGPVITVRRATTTVSVADGRTVVIGGLISDASADGVSKIPFLGDIPYLGRLFRYEADQNKRVNLIIFLTPHVIRTAEDLADVTDSERRRFRDSAGDPDRVLPGDPQPAAEPAMDSAAAGAAAVGVADGAAEPTAVQPAAAAPSSDVAPKATEPVRARSGSWSPRIRRGPASPTPRPSSMAPGTTGTQAAVATSANEANTEATQPAPYNAAAQPFANAPPLVAPAPASSPTQPIVTRRSAPQSATTRPAQAMPRAQPVTSFGADPTNAPQTVSLGSPPVQASPKSTPTAVAAPRVAPVATVARPIPASPPLHTIPRDGGATAAATAVATGSDANKPRVVVVGSSGAMRVDRIEQTSAYDPASHWSPFDPADVEPPTIPVEAETPSTVSPNQAAFPAWN